MKRISLVVLGRLARKRRAPVSTSRWSTTTSPPAQTELAQKMYVQNGLGRFVDPEGRATLIKGDTLYIVDDADKSYIAFDKATMEQLAKKISAQMEQMKEQLAKLPPEQRAQMEQMMPGMSGGDAEVDRGSRRHRQVRQGRWARLPDLGHQAQRRARRPAVRGAVLVAARQGKFPGRVREFRQGVRGNGEIRPHVGRHDDQRIRRAGQGERFPGALARL